MSQTHRSPDPTDSSIRPPSVWTNNSVFADSAISMGSRTPKHPEDMIFDTQPPPSSEHGISDRLNQLAAAAWATEQDLPLDYTRQKRIQKALEVIEQCLHESEEPSPEASGEEEKEEAAEQHEPERQIEPRDSTTQSATEREQLEMIHQDLRATVNSMRWRQQEQRHLNRLSLEKLESVAQTCLVQKYQVDELMGKVQDLRVENHNLGEENNKLRDRVTKLELQATHREVAVSAMSTAVAGLEGWINGSRESVIHDDTARQKRGRYVIRGKGRFRGRYWIEEPEDGDGGNAAGTFSTSRELHDGVQAWLRGFRDVEEELQKASPGQRMSPEGPRVNIASMTNEEWGDFETASDMG